MSLATWYKQATAPKTSPRLEQLLQRTAIYLSQNLRDEEFAPKIVGAALGESELAVMTALSILERLEITKHHFGVYCGATGTSLTSVDDLATLSENYACEICDRDHSLRDQSCRVEIYFTVFPDKLARFIAKTSAS